MPWFLVTAGAVGQHLVCVRHSARNFLQVVSNPHKHDGYFSSHFSDEEIKAQIKVFVPSERQSQESNPRVSSKTPLFLIILHV